MLLHERVLHSQRITADTIIAGNIRRNFYTVKMADDDEALHRCVTKFMLDTCRYPMGEYTTDVRLFRFISEIIAPNSPDFGVLLASGSSAELCIKPMLSCIGDIDIMCHQSCYLAIPHGHIPPTLLPTWYQRIVYVFEIIDSHPQPGFVYLLLSYSLVKSDNDRYLATKIINDVGLNFCISHFRDDYRSEAERVQSKEHEETILHRADRYSVQKCMKDTFHPYANLEFKNHSLTQSLLTPAAASHGPAVKVTCNANVFKVYKPAHRSVFLSNFDAVSCIRCLIWPPQANMWPTRNRDHGWPHQGIINVVVRNGCDVVGAVHPCCRQDEFMSDYQCRLSFSRAEVTLLNSWTKVQQIIYHMLRFVMKRQVLTEEYEKDPNLPKLSNYHIKTLMLWECEQKPQSWWSAESSLIKLCSSLLHKLSDCVVAKCCQQYFLNNCNLLDHFMDYGDNASLMICNRLNSLANERFLLNWFVENYIRKCAEFCPPEMSVLFGDISSGEKLQRVTDAVVSWKMDTLPQELLIEHYKPESLMLTIIILYHWDACMIPNAMKRLQNFDPRLLDYFVALISLGNACSISIHSLTEDILENLWALFDPCTAADCDKGTTALKSGGILFIRKAIKLAHMCGVESYALQMLYNEMSKAYLHHCFAYGQKSTYCVVHVLLAALYYKSGHYQAAIDHCKQVLKQTACKQFGVRSIGAEYLPQIDESVAVVFGLVLLYEQVQQKALYPGVCSQQDSGKPAFTTELLACYLYSNCPSIANSKSINLAQYQRHLLEFKRPLLSDVLLFKRMKLQLDECPAMPTASVGPCDGNTISQSMDTSLLVTSLELVALEKLITYRQMMVRELHSEQFPVLNEFQALYAYKCGLFEQCLEMCRHHVSMLLRVSFPLSQRCMVLAYPQYVSPMDGELLSLFGIIRLLQPVWFLLFLQFPEYESISVLTFSLYLMVQCQKKLRKGLLHESLQLCRYCHENVFPAGDKEHFLDRLILKLTYRSLKLHIDDSTEQSIHYR